MKQLIALTVVLLIVGIGGFMYRNALEHPVVLAPTGVACTQEAKMCPDGSSIGRTGPECTFSPCLLPNAEDTTIHIGFVIPEGYVANADAIGADETLRAVFDKPSKGEVPHSIIIRAYPIAEGKTGDEIILEHTMFEPSGTTPASMKEFTPVLINGKTYQSVVLERFEGQVHSAYYLVRATDVLTFEVLEKDVDWTNPKLVVGNLPEHKALQLLLATLQTP
jgi:hypothetical protein